MKLIEIESIEIISTNNKKMYDFEVENDHSYCVGVDKLIVHNSVCTTRLVTGVGRPQLSAVMDCADAAHKKGGLVISDGGCVHIGDISKAFGAGANFVMLGSMLAGHDEGGQENNGKVIFHGSSYNQRKGITPEGKEVILDYKGPVEHTILNILGGLKSACSYVGASKLSEFSDKVEFYRVGNTHNRSLENG